MEPDRTPRDMTLAIPADIIAQAEKRVTVTGRTLRGELLIALRVGTDAVAWPLTTKDAPAL